MPIYVDRFIWIAQWKYQNWTHHWAIKLPTLKVLKSAILLVLEGWHPMTLWMLINPCLSSHCLNECSLTEIMKVQSYEISSESVESWTLERHQISHCIDAKGLSKEFFAMLSAALRGGCGRCTLFEGSSDHLLPVISEEFHQSDYFVYVRKLVGMCVLHGGAGVVGLSRALAVYMVTVDIEMASSYMSVEDVPDFNIQEKILQISIIRAIASLILNNYHDVCRDKCLGNLTFAYLIRSFFFFM